MSIYQYFSKNTLNYDLIFKGIIEKYQNNLIY